jgi:hypothetical protein
MADAGGVILLVSGIITQTNAQGGYLADSDASRRLSFQIMQELRNSVPSNTGGYALETAQAQQIVFYSNIDGGIDIERIRYFVQSGKLMKGVTKPTGSPLTYNLANENTYTVQNNIANGGNALFYYYNGSYAGTTDNYLSQPVNVSQVTFVKLNMQVYHKGKATGTAYSTVIASASIRNLKTNLGN